MTRFFIGILVLFCLAVGACRSDERALRAPDSIPVVTTRVEIRDIPVEIRSVGTAEASLSAAVVPQVTGILTEVRFQEGQKVKAGETLFLIDPAPYQTALRRAEAALAEKRVQQADADVQAGRYQSLVGKEFVSRQQFDDAAVKAKALAAAVKASEAELEQRKLELGYCTVQAPISGRTGDILVRTGNLVKANEPQNVMTRINQLSPVYIRFSVPEQFLPEIRKEAAAGELAVSAQTPGSGAPAARGTLFFIDNEIDRTTGTVLLKGLFANENEALWPGQYVDVTLQLGNRRGVPAIPSQAIQVGQQGAYVFVVLGNETVEPRVIKTGVAYSGSTEVLSGLERGERIVVEGLVRLRPGARIQESSPSAVPS